MTVYYYLIYSSGAGNHYGTFSGTITAFSPVSKGKKAADSPGKNFLTNPPKKGTGYGYLHVTIGAPAKYMSDAYERARELRKVRCYHNPRGGAPLYRLKRYVQPLKVWCLNNFGLKKDMFFPLV